MSKPSAGGSRTLEKAPTTVHGMPLAGGVGSLPPPANPIAVAIAPDGATVIRQTEAPVEVASGVDSAARTVPSDKQANEQSLQPLKGPKGPPLTGAALVAAVGAQKAALIEASRSGAVAVVPPKPSQAAVPVPLPVASQPAPTVTAAGALSQAASALGLRRPRRKSAAAPPVATTPVVEAGDDVRDDVDAVSQQLAQHLDTEDVPLAPVQPHQKAASNTDSPSRGIPQPIADPGKKITGGFGELTDGQYHPLNGHELRTLVDGLLSELHARLADDLRFSMALTYPRVRARVTITVEGVAAENGFAIEKLRPEPAAGKPGSTPMELAKTLGDQIVFVVVAERMEFDDAGNSISPPNAIREELGVEVPRKQRVETPTGYTFTDRKMP